MLAYYTGEKSEGVELLDRATRLGLDSKMFDPQALLLLAFARLDNNDQRGLARTVDQLTRLRDRSHAPARPHRLLGMAESLLALQHQNTARALDDVRRLANDALSPDFDFETACNLLALMGRLQMRSIALNESEAAVDTLALRFCTSKAMSELMACAASGVQGFADRVRSAHSQILKMTEQAMTLSIKGDPQGTVMKLLEDGERTLNAKLIESAHQVLQRYNVRIADHEALASAPTRCASATAPARSTRAWANTRARWPHRAVCRCPPATSRRTPTACSPAPLISAAANSAITCSRNQRLSGSPSKRWLQCSDTVKPRSTNGGCTTTQPPVATKPCAMLPGITTHRSVACTMEGSTMKCSVVRRRRSCRPVCARMRKVSLCVRTATKSSWCKALSRAGPRRRASGACMGWPLRMSTT